MTTPLDAAGEASVGARDQHTSDQREDRIAAGGILGAHALHHTFSHGFYVVLPEIYASMGLTPVAVGALEAVRRAGGGVASMVGGFLLDRFQDKRILVLYLSLLSMGVGYVLVGLAPTYVIVLLAVGLVGAAGSIWHPAALGLLSQAFPHRRGFVVSLHRSSGSVGDVVGPLVVGAALAVVAWPTITYSAFPLALASALALWLLLRKASRWRASGRTLTPEERRPFAEQFRALTELLRGRHLLMLLLVAGLNGLGQGGLLLWLGLYLRDTQGMSSVGIGFHVALLTAVGIVAGPFIGGLSDRIGRKAIIVAILAVKSTLSVLLALVGSGLMFTVLVASMGGVMFGVNALIQAAALDLADGKQLEGSMVGLLWGNNAVFGGVSPMLLGALIASVGYGILFWYLAAANLAAMLAATTLPVLAGRRAP